MNQANQQAAFALKHFVVREKPIFQIFLREGLRGWVCFVGSTPHPARDRDSLDSALAECMNVFQTDNSAAWSGASTGFDRLCRAYGEFSESP